jgi:hypothetical protein
VNPPIPSSATIITTVCHNPDISARPVGGTGQKEAPYAMFPWEEVAERTSGQRGHPISLFLLRMMHLLLQTQLGVKDPAVQQWKSPAALYPELLLPSTTVLPMREMSLQDIHMPELHLGAVTVIITLDLSSQVLLHWGACHL